MYKAIRNGSKQEVALKKMQLTPNSLSSIVSEIQILKVLFLRTPAHPITELQA